MADWKSLEIQVPGKNALEPVRNVLETLLIFLDVLKAILDTIKIFLIDFGNPIKILVESLIRLIEELFLSLKTSGVLAYFDVPDPTQDPNFDGFQGGFPAFSDRFKNSLFDPLDFNRPQPRAGSTQSGFVMLVVSADAPFTLIERVKQLYRFFGKEFTSPRYEPPGNLLALPVGDKGDPLLSVVSVFTEGPINSIQLQWTLPTSLDTPDPGFTDVVTKVAREFVPPNFLIERSTVNPAAQRISVSALQTATSSGTVEFNRQTWSNVRDPGDPVYVREILRDEYKDPVVKFQKYTIIDQLSVTSILGQLGRFRYIDQDVEENTTYYYRVRAFSGDLMMNGNQPAFPTSETQLISSGESNAPLMKWPTTPNSSLVMGKASGITACTVPKHISPATFDVIDNLYRLFLTAFSLDYHLQVSQDAQFTPNGVPIAPTSVTEVGKGTLSNLAGSLAIYEAFLVVGQLIREVTISAGFQPDPVTGNLPSLPWQKFPVQRQSARLANAVASALLQAGSDSLNGFSNIMQEPFPAGPITTGGTLVGTATLEQLVRAFTSEPVDIKTVITFVDSYSDISLRFNVLAAIQYVKSYSLGGATVDWITVVPLRDIVPWSGQMIYDLLDKMRALLDAFQGVSAEIKAFIDIVERKIQALERFIEFLINILNFIESLQIGAYVLSVPELNGNAQSWVQAIDSAGGSKPPAGPGGYSAGIVLGYVAPDIQAFKTAFSIIFG